MNKVTLTGRITAKPELRHTGSDVPYTRFSIAVNRNFSSANGERGTDFFNVIVWRRQAENVCQYLDKGSLVGIEGRLQSGNYTDKDGNKRTSIDVVADNVEFLESKGQRQSSSNDSSSPYDYQDQPFDNGVDVDNDPFADFGDNVSIDDNFLD